MNIAIKTTIATITTIGILDSPLTDLAGELLEIS